MARSGELLHATLLVNTDWLIPDKGERKGGGDTQRERERERERELFPAITLGCPHPSNRFFLRKEPQMETGERDGN